MLLPGIGWPGGSLENTGIILGVILGAYVGSLWLAALVWTIRDIHQRTRDPITQLIAALIVLFFNFPGWILYLVLRPPMTLNEIYDRELESEALLQELPNDLTCPTCEALIGPDYVACPYCATSLKAMCHECKRTVAFSWVACAWCGTEREPTDISEDLEKTVSPQD